VRAVRNKARFGGKVGVRRAGCEGVVVHGGDGSGCGCGQAGVGEKGGSEMGVCTPAASGMGLFGVVFCDVKVPLRLFVSEVCCCCCCC